MKTALILLVLGVILIQADALRCRQTSCVGSRPCHSREVTCDKDVDHCFSMMKSKPIFMFTRGCIKEANCNIMKAYEPSTRCCTANLCN